MAVVVQAAEFSYQDDELYLVEISALDKYERSFIADSGVDIIEVREDSVLALVTDRHVRALVEAGFTVDDVPLPDVGLAFPPADSNYHDYAEVGTALTAMANAHPQWAKLFTFGHSIENRNLYLLRITSNPSSNEYKPAVWFMGAHHAREHMSVEVPLALAGMLLANVDSNPTIQNWLNTREVWVSPMINPDGAEYDISTGSYQYWRKNRRNNGDGSYGVDLNRNYGYQWGGPGSSGYTWDETYRGTAAFSEPETDAIRDWIVAHPVCTEIVSYHSYSELVLYPWGYTYNGIGGDDGTVLSRMAGWMAYFTGYTAQQSSDLYLTSGDTCDWAYGAEGIFCWTIELYPVSSYPGFYPPDEKINMVIGENWKAAALAIMAADDPYKVLDITP
jgi:carboxypeptidase T